MKQYPKYKNSNIPWLGEIPEHWVLERGKRFLISKKEINKYYQCKDILSLTLRGVVDNDFDNPEGLVPKDYATYQIFEKNNLVFKLIDLENFKTSRVGLVHKRGIMSPAYIRIIIPEIFNPKYYFYLYFSWYLNRVYNKIGFGVRSTLSANNLLELFIPFPPLSEQIHIARYLDWKVGQINKFIKANKRLLELLNEQKQAIINDAVTGKIDVRTGKPYPKYKPSGVEWLGDIPEDWEVRRLKNVCRFIYGTSLETTKRVEQGDINVFGSNGIVGKHNVAITEAPCLIIGRKGSFGKVNFSPEKCFPIDTTYFVDSTVTKDNLEWLYYLLIILKLDSYSKDSAIPGLSREDAYKNFVPIINIDEQIKIVFYIQEKTQAIDQTISRIEREIELIKEYKDRLIADVVTGKVDIREIEVPEVIEDIEEEILEAENEELEEIEGEE